MPIQAIPCKVKVFCLTAHGRKLMVRYTNSQAVSHNVKTKVPNTKALSVNVILPAYT
jgi:hypothetical protein